MLSSLLPSAILLTGELWDFLSFTERYPSVIYNIMLFGVTSALGQVGGGTTDAHDLSEILHIQLTLFHMSLPDLHFPDCGQLWTPDLLHRHNHKEVLHHPRLGSSVWQLHEHAAVDRHRSGLPRWESIHTLSHFWDSANNCETDDWPSCFKTRHNPSDVPVVSIVRFWLFHFRSWIRC